MADKNLDYPRTFLIPISAMGTSSYMNRRNGLNGPSGTSPKRTLPTPYENIQIMIKKSKANHAAVG